MLNVSFEWRIGLRYLLAGKKARRNSFISFISLVSVLGIGLGVAALIIVLSVMNGFQKDVRDRMLSVLAHVEIRGRNLGVENWQDVKKTVEQHPLVVASAPFVSTETVLIHQGTMKGARIRGIDPESEKKVNTTPLTFNNQGFSMLAAHSFAIILGRDLAQLMGVKIGDTVSVLIPSGTITPAGMVPRFKLFTVVDLFESGHYEYDSNLAYIHQADAQTLLRLQEPDGLRVRVSDISLSPLVAAELFKEFWYKPYVEDISIADWSRQNRNWFAAVQTEKRLMAIILTLIVAVATFNLVSSLVMTVTEKHGDIAILRTMGASRLSIMKIFIFQGASSGFIGSLSGVLLGTLVATNIDVIVPAIEGLLGFQFLPKSIYLISSLPSDPQAADIITIAIASFILSLLATIYPSYRATCVEPAQTLRYE